MAVTMEVLVAATVVMKTRKELVTKPRCESLPDALHSPSQLVPASYRSHSCWPGAEHFDTYFTGATLSHEEVKSCLFKVTESERARSPTCLSPLVPALTGCLPLQSEVPGQCPNSLGGWARTGSCTLTQQASVW